MSNPSASSPRTTKNMKSKKKLRPIISFVSENYQSFKQIEIDPETQSIDLSDNYIENFNGLPFLKYLTNLNLDDNPMISFEGAIQLPCLKWLSMKNTPLSRNKYFKIICVIAFGPQLGTINNEYVTDSIRQKAEVLKKPLIPYLKKGFVISNLNPLRLSNFRLETINNLPNQALVNAVSSLIYTPPSERSPVSSPSKREVQRASVSTMITLFKQNENIENIIPSTMIKFIAKNIQALRNRFNDETPINDELETKESIAESQLFKEEEEREEENQERTNEEEEEEINNEIKEKQIDIDIEVEEEDEEDKKMSQISNSKINLGEEEEDQNTENEQRSRSSSRSSSSSSDKEEKSHSETEEEEKSHSESDKEEKSHSESEKEEKSHSETEEEEKSHSENESETQSEKTSKKQEEEEKNEVTSNSSGSEREEKSNSENEEEEKSQNKDDENKEEEDK